MGERRGGERRKGQEKRREVQKACVEGRKEMQTALGAEGGGGTRRDKVAASSAVEWGLREQKGERKGEREKEGGRTKEADGCGKESRETRDRRTKAEAGGRGIGVELGPVSRGRAARAMRTHAATARLEGRKKRETPCDGDGDGDRKSVV